jgi:cytoskeletal protein CcmA (bactofilin family)
VTKIKTFSTSEFHQDTEIEDDVCITGTSIAYGRFSAFSLILEKNFTVEGELATIKGSLKARGDLKVGSDLTCEGDIITEKNCYIGGSISGKKVRLRGINNSAESINASTLRLEGNVDIKNTVTALKSIHIILNPRRYRIDIGGKIEAPAVTVIFGGWFTKWSLLSDKIFGRISRNDKRVKRQFDLKQLRITTQKLRIITRFPSSRVELISNQAEIDAKEIEIIQSLL